MEESQRRQKPIFESFSVYVRLIADDRTRTSTLLLEVDFESTASTNFATSACIKDAHIKENSIFMKRILAMSIPFIRFCPSVNDPLTNLFIKTNLQ